jgi:uncharacterized protein (UPF0276 family)
MAFVRADGVEIGHLAAPPRTRLTVEGTAANVERMRAATGTRPLLENVATLLDPPGSELSEPEWTARVLEASGCGLLLDLHNLHANAVNFGYDALEMLERVPAERIQAVHLAGGRLVQAPNTDAEARAAVRLLDDHRHEVPDAVYGLLREVARRCPGPLTVVLERDGAFPRMDSLLGELDRARQALREGRALQGNAVPAGAAPRREPVAGLETAGLDEALLARMYVDAAFRRRLLADPVAEAARLGLTPGQAYALRRIDRPGLELAAASFGHKRARRHAP